MRKPKIIETLPAVRLEVDATKPVNFREANKALKRQMLLEYKSLPPDAKAGWREAHNASQALVSYHMVRLRPRGNRPPPNPLLDAITLPMLNHYLSLPHAGGQKSAWLREHGLNHQQIFEVKKRLAPSTIEKGKFNGTGNGHAKPHVDIQIHPHHAAPRTSTSLDEAINAMKVKRDMLTEFITDLERMRH